jgi:lipopolysaccharide transport system ATP-binding protein
MNDVTKKGRTVLFVSHNMMAVRSLCSRAFFLSGGSLLFVGKTNEAIDRYLLSISGDMATEINTRSLARPSVVVDDSTLRITCLRLTASGQRAVLYTGEPIRLKIDFEVSRLLEDVVLAWSVHSGDNVRLLECQSARSWGPRSFHPGKYSVECVVRENPLNPGLYTLHVGARCSAKGLDYLPDVFAFRVDAKDEFASLWLEAPSGLIRLSSDWTSPLSVDRV